MGYEKLEKESLITVEFALKLAIKSIANASSNEEFREENISSWKKRLEEELKIVHKELILYG